MNNYSIEVSELNPMETAPLWDYYDGSVETVILFYKHVHGGISTVVGYFNRTEMKWASHYYDDVIEEEIIGWLPNYVSISSSRF